MVLLQRALQEGFEGVTTPRSQSHWFPEQGGADLLLKSPTFSRILLFRQNLPLPSNFETPPFILVFYHPKRGEGSFH